ncbi:MAG: PIN domain-containing protein [Vicinamibacterales bacterium]
MSLAALDTNVLVYAEHVNGAARREQAIDLVARLSPDATFIPAQALAELFHVLTRKAGWGHERAGQAVLAWGDAFPIIDTSSSVLLSALTLSRDHHLGVWDAVIMAAASEARCRVLLSEDLQDGFSWSGVTVVNPFASEPNPLLERLAG